MLGFNVIGFAISPIWGDIADHYGRKIMVLRAMLGMGFVMALVPFAQTPLWFAVMVVLVGFFYGYMNASMALLVANTPPRRIGSALAFAQTGGMVGQTIGPAVGAMLAALIDRQHWLFWISGGLMLSGGALVALFVREKKQIVAGPWRPDWVGSLRELLAVPHMGPLYLLSFLFAALWYGNVTIISIYMLQLLAAQPASAGTEAFWVGAAAMGLAVTSVVAVPLWGRALDRFGPTRILLFATAAAALTHAPLLFPADAAATRAGTIGVRPDFRGDAARNHSAGENARAGRHGCPCHLLRLLVPVHRHGPGAVLRGSDRTGAGAARILRAVHRAHAGRLDAVAAQGGKSRIKAVAGPSAGGPLRAEASAISIWCGSCLLVGCLFGRASCAQLACTQPVRRHDLDKG